MSKQLDDAVLKKIMINTEIYSHLDHMDVGLISFIRGMEMMYVNPNL